MQTIYILRKLLLLAINLHPPNLIQKQMIFLLFMVGRIVAVSASVLGAEQRGAVPFTTRDIVEIIGTLKRINFNYHQVHILPRICSQTIPPIPRLREPKMHTQVLLLLMNNPN